jgi:predicted PhzF superfamily epimerase YddE/YHI9
MDYLVQLGSEGEVRALRPDLEVLKRVDCRGVIVTAQADPGQPYAVVSRFFAPAIGIPEDHATGSAHCALAPHWSERLGPNAMPAHQASPRGRDHRARHLQHVKRPGDQFTRSRARQLIDT